MKARAATGSWLGAVQGMLGPDVPETRAERLRFRALELFLLGYAVYWAWSWGSFIRTIPALVAPHGLALDIDLSFFVASPLAEWNAALISACAVALGCWQRRARWLWPVLIVALHVQYVARHCLGKVAHGSQYVGLGLWMLMLAALCFPVGKEQRRFALRGTLFAMGAGYVCAGVSKLVARGWRWPDGSHLWLWIAEKQVDTLSDFGAVRLNGLQRLCLEHWSIATAVLAVGLATELAGFLLWFSRTRVAVATALIGLHLGIYFSLGILFDTYIFQLVLVALPWPSLLAGRLGPRSGPSREAVPSEGAAPTPAREQPPAKAFRAAG